MYHILIFHTDELVSHILMNIASDRKSDRISPLNKKHSQCAVNVEAFCGVSIGKIVNA